MLFEMKIVQENVSSLITRFFLFLTELTGRERRKEKKKGKKYF